MMTKGQNVRLKKCSAPLSTPVNATASRRPVADVDRRGRRAVAIASAPKRVSLSVSPKRMIEGSPTGSLPYFASDKHERPGGTIGRGPIIEGGGRPSR